MPRHPNDQPTPAELEVLKILWDYGPLTVRGVMGHLSDARAYTTIQTLMIVMYDKDLLIREPEGKAFLYRPAIPREFTLRNMLGDMVSRAFDGSASALVAHLLDQAQPTDTELDEIRKLIAEHKRKEG